MLSRLLWGGRMTLVAGLTPVLVAFVVGAALGVMAGYVGGLTNTLIMRTMDIFYAFPAVLLAIAISGALGPGLAEHPHLAVHRLRAAGRARGRVRHRAGEGPRVHRGRARQRRRASGPSSGTTCSPTCWARSSCSRAPRCRSSIILAAGLSFLGLGVTPPAAEWGLMLNTLRQSIYVNAIVPALPGVAIFVTSMAFNLLSDGLRDAMEIRG